jgi:drug/metabolite transporter (DMT)-like permease
MSAYLLLVLIWGSSYAITEVALSGFTPTGIALWRSLIGAGFLTVAMVVTGERLPRLGRSGAVRILALGALTTTAHVMVATAQLRMPSGAVAVLCSTTPLIAIGFYWLRRIPIPPIKWLSVSLGVVGVGVLLSPEAHLDHLGLTLGLLAAALFALAGILAAQFFPDSTFSGTQLTAAQLAVGAVLLTPVIAVKDANHELPAWPHPGPLAALLALGLLAAGIGNVLFWRVLRTAGPVFAATTYQSVPVVAVLIGVVALGESLGAGEIIGAGLVLAGLMLLLPVVRAAAAGADARVEEGLIGSHSEACGAVQELETVRREHNRRAGQGLIS